MLDVDHFRMNKFRSRDDGNYQLVIYQLKSLITKTSKSEGHLTGGVTETRATPAQGPKTAAEVQEILLSSLHFDESTNRYTYIKDSEYSTCDWIFEVLEFQRWTTSTGAKEGPAFLWIRAKAGAGKSTLMKFLFKDFQRNSTDDLVISFFFNARGGSNLEKSVEDMYRSLLHQIICNLPFDSHILQDRSGRILPFSLTELYKWSLRQLEVLFHEVVKDLLRSRSIICFVDALDESDENEIRAMIQTMTKLCCINTRQNTCKLCLSTRPYPNLITSYGEKIDIAQEPGHEDGIATYICDALTDIPDSEALVLKDMLLARADGVFLWVELVVKRVLQTYTEDPGVDLGQLIKDTPETLDEFYHDAILRDKSTSRTRFRASIICFQLILFAEWVYWDGFESLYHAVVAFTQTKDSVSRRRKLSEKEMKQYIINISKGLAETRESRDYGPNRWVVQFIHQSVRDFLIGRNGLSSLDPDIRADNVEGSSHEHLKSKCVETYKHAFSITPHHLNPSLSSGHPAAYIEACNEPSFVATAILGAIYHCDAAESHGISQKAFLKGGEFSLQQWIQLYNKVVLPARCRNKFTWRPWSVSPRDDDDITSPFESESAELPAHASELHVFAKFDLPHLVKKCLEEDPGLLAAYSVRPLGPGECCPPFSTAMLHLSNRVIRQFFELEMASETISSEVRTRLGLIFKKCVPLRNGSGNVSWGTMILQNEGSVSESILAFNEAYWLFLREAGRLPQWQPGQHDATLFCTLMEVLTGRRRLPRSINLDDFIFAELLKLAVEFVNQEQIDLNITNDQGAAPFHLFTDAQSWSIRRELLEVHQLIVQHRSADPNLQQQQDKLNTALHYAVGLSMDRRPEITEYRRLEYRDGPPMPWVRCLLQQQRLDPNIRNKFGQTALQDAIWHAEYVEVLLEDNRVDPNVRDVEGKTALHRAAEEPECILGPLADDCLREASDIDWDNYNPFLGNRLPSEEERREYEQLAELERSTWEKPSARLTSLELLLQNPRVDPTITDSTGRTALHCASMAMVPEHVAAILTDGRIEPSSKDNDGKTALDIALDRCAYIWRVCTTVSDEDVHYVYQEYYFDSLAQTCVYKLAAKIGFSAIARPAGTGFLGLQSELWTLRGRYQGFIVPVTLRTWKEREYRDEYKEPQALEHEYDLRHDVRGPYTRKRRLCYRRRIEVDRVEVD